MKTLLALLLFVAPALGQTNPGLTQAQAACGPPSVRFDAEFSPSRQAAQPEPGKALVYVVGDYWPSMIDPTIRVGLDGAWLGATRARSYIYFSVNPGEHHLCANWQSSLKRLSRLITLAHLTAGPGETYYFRVRITYFPRGEAEDFDLQPLDPDEGRYLVASYLLSKSHPKK